jgi:hypothetical protein
MSDADARLEDEDGFPVAGDGDASPAAGGGAASLSATAGGKSKLAMSSKFTAELGLLQSLGNMEAQRARQKEQFAKENPGLSAVRAADKDTLRGFRVVPGAEAERDAAAEQEAVKALPHTLPTVHRRRGGTKLASEEPSQRLESLHRTRQERHEAKVAKFDEERAAITADVEHKVTTLAAGLKADLQAATDNVARLFARLGNGDTLAAHSMAQVRQAWADLEAQCARHKQAVEEFGDKLSTVEKERAAAVLELVRKLAYDLVVIGHQLPDAVERFVEQQAEPVNLVVLRNARAYAAMMARLRKKDVSLFLSARARHRQAVRDWRLLRHNEVIRRFNERVDSEEFVDPLSRRQLFDDARATRKNRHTKSRLKVMQRLRSLTPPVLDSVAVAQVRDKFAEINREEEAWCVVASSTLCSIPACMHACRRRRRRRRRRCCCC